MGESDESRSFASMSMDDSNPAEEPVRAGTEGYSLVILIKSLALIDAPEDEERKLGILMTLGDSEVSVTGTVTEINEQRRGNAVSIPSANAEEFKQYLMSHDLKIVVSQEGNELGQTTIQLAKTNLVTFDPPEFESTIISKSFSVEHGSSSIGTINLILKTDRMRSAVELDASKIEDDSILFIVNDSPQRRSSEIQEDTMRQLLTCKKCNVFKSPSEVSYQYELMDGILVNKEYPRKDPDLETMKRKIAQIEREAKLYPVGTEQEPLKETTGSRFCNGCGGYSVTGATCPSGTSGLRDTPMLGAPLYEATFSFPEGNAKRFSEYKDNGTTKNFTRVSEPDFANSKNAGFRSNQMRSESLPFPTTHQHEPNYLCSQSVGNRFCQRCGLNLDWLPQSCSCPKCGYKNLVDRPGSPLATMHEITPSMMNSWLGSYEPQNFQRRHSSAAAIRSASLEIRPCPLCRLRGGRCPDCQKQASLAQQENHVPNITTLSSTSDSEMFARQERPKTRLSLRERFGGFPKKIDKATRLTELQKLYGEEGAPVPDKHSRKSTRTSTVSLNVEEILKKSEAHKKKIVSGGVQSVELRKIDLKAASSASIENGCSALSAAQIRKNQRNLLRRIKKQNRGKYSYLYGNRYPGIVAGHRECIHQGSLVPPHMGWRWNVKTPGIGRIRKGWRPGAVRKPIKELMQHFLVSYPLDNIPVSKKGSRRLTIAEPDSGKIKQKPSLQIVKRNGEYSIVMNPLKDSETLKNTQDPYLPCEPIRFKLAKAPKMGKLHQLRKALKVKGFNLCGCSELATCTHRSDKEKKLIKREIMRLSKTLGLPKATELKDIPSDSESELDLEFTPPSAMLKSGMRQPDVVCTETQYCVEDYKVQIPADKLKCKPGREDPCDTGKGARVRIGRGMDKADPNSGKGGKGEPWKTGGVKSTADSGKGAPKKGKGISTGAGKGAGAGAGVGGAANTKKAGPIGKGAVGATAGAGNKNKSQKIHRPVGSQIVHFNESCKTSNLCAPSYCKNVPVGCSTQSTNGCYTSSCAPANCYNPCYTGCMQ